MKHLKKFNESLDYSNVEPNSKYDQDDYLNYAEGTVDEVERATGKKVTKISGVSGETEMDYEIELEDGSTISTDYTFHPHNDKLVITYYNASTNEKKSKSSRDSDFDFKDAGNDVYQLLIALIKEMEPEDVEPTHYISFPKEMFGTKGYHYEFQNHPVNGGEVYFDSEEDAKEWLSSLKINVFKNESPKNI